MQKTAKIRGGVLLAAALLVGLVAAIYATRSSSAGTGKACLDGPQQNARQDDPRQQQRPVALLAQRRAARQVHLQDLVLSLDLDASHRAQGHEADRRRRAGNGQAARRQDPGCLPRRTALHVLPGHEAWGRQGQRLQGRRRMAGGRGLEGQCGSGGDSTGARLPLLRLIPKARRPSDPRPSRPGVTSVPESPRRSRRAWRASGPQRPGSASSRRSAARPRAPYARPQSSRPGDRPRPARRRRPGA